MALAKDRIAAGRRRLKPHPKEIHGRWLIVHDHVSVPVDLNTGKPDLASKP